MRSPLMTRLPRPGTARAGALLGAAALLIGLGLPWTARAFRLSPPLPAEVQRARSSGQLLLVKVTTSWCPACREQSRLLAGAAVARALQSYRRLAYDAEQGEGKDVAERYNVVAFPTLLVLGGDGLELGRLTGQLPAAELIARLTAIRQGQESLARLEQRAAGSADLKLRLRVGSEWAWRGRRLAASRHLEAVVAGDPENRQGLAARALLVQAKYLLLRSLGDHQAAAQMLQELRRRFPSAAEAEEAVIPLAEALHRLGQRQAALRLLDGWARDAEQHAAVAWFCRREGADRVRCLAHARRAVALAPTAAAAWATLAELELRAGQVERARASWARARALDPDNPRTRGPLPGARHQEP